MSCASPHDTKPCRPCSEGGACAYVLVLSSRDEQDAQRLWNSICPPGEEHTPRAIDLRPSPQEQQRTREQAEPTEVARCLSCGRTFEQLAYLAAFLREHGGRPTCEACGTGAARSAA